MANDEEIIHIFCVFQIRNNLEKKWVIFNTVAWGLQLNRGADKSLDRPGRKQANVSVRMA